MEKYIKEIRETILDCWELDGMSSRYFDKLQNSLNCLESEVLKLNLDIVTNRTFKCNRCGVIYELIGHGDVGCCVSLAEYRTSRICGGELIEVTTN